MKKNTNMINDFDRDMGPVSPMCIVWKFLDDQSGWRVPTPPSHFPPIFPHIYSDTLRTTLLHPARPTAPYPESTAGGWKKNKSNDTATQFVWTVWRLFGWVSSSSLTCHHHRLYHCPTLNDDFDSDVAYQQLLGGARSRRAAAALAQQQCVCGVEPKTASRSARSIPVSGSRWHQAPPPSSLVDRTRVLLVRYAARGLENGTNISRLCTPFLLRAFGSRREKISHGAVGTRNTVSEDGERGKVCNACFCASCCWLLAESCGFRCVVG